MCLTILFSFEIATVSIVPLIHLLDKVKLGNYTNYKDALMDERNQEP